MERRESAAPVGAGMLLVSFAVLCLVAFAALCLSSAGAEDRLSRASAETLLARREADAEAEAILARLRSASGVRGRHILSAPGGKYPRETCRRTSA